IHYNSSILRYNFLFSSRRRHTRSKRDWSSDVCSSDLGSGKTTYARTLERAGFQRLSIDEEAWARGHRRQPLAQDLAAAIEDQLRERLVRLVGEGRDVVVDFSFWSRNARAQYRQLLAGLGVR